ncbi:MAG: hypothetical protein IPK16_18420 [Anaerolineales bacterium]|nr:hypothetical protein [Anaerolineales bacterium]
MTLSKPFLTFLAVLIFGIFLSVFRVIDATGADMAMPNAPLPAYNLLSAQNGWVLAGDELWITGDGGDTWRNATPPGSSQSVVWWRRTRRWMHRLGLLCRRRYGLGALSWQQ